MSASRRVLRTAGAITLAALMSGFVSASAATASRSARQERWPTVRRLIHWHGERGSRRLVDRAQLSFRARAAIVGGIQIGVAQAPWQVFVLSVIPVSKEESLLLLCGGSIVDETHIVTAGHCMFDPETGSRVPAADVVVVAGTSDFAKIEPEEQERDAAAVRVHSDYDYASGAGAPDDVAVVELATPLSFDTVVRPIDLVPAGGAPSEGQPVNLTGFGAETFKVEPEGPLHSLSMTVGFSGSCGGQADGAFLCASSASGSGCNGDSGSGLTYGAIPTLVGIMDTVQVLSGQACFTGDDNGFVNVAAPEIRDFIEGSEDPPIAPRGGGVTLRAVVKVGYTATCEPGSWSGSPTFSYEFLNSANDDALQTGSSSTYQLTQADVGLAISCEVLASNSGGTAAARTTALSPVEAVEESSGNSGLSTEVYHPPELPWANESGKKAAEESVKEQRAKEANELKTREEREAIERVQREEEARIRELEARTDQPAKAAAQHCVVPSLKGDSLAKAQSALARAHCRLGKVTEQHGSHGAALVVTHQRTVPGKQLPAGTRVGLTIGPRKRSSA